MTNTISICLPNQNTSEPDVERTTVLTTTDRAMLEDMHEQIKQLKKLDLLHDMIKDITELKSAVDFTNNLIENLNKSSKQQ